MKLIGTSGGTVGYVLAQHNDWPGLWSTTQVWENDGSGHDLYYVNGGAVNLYEACWKGHGKYWMGGTGSSKPKAVEVLHTVADPNTNAGNHQFYDGNQGTAVAYPAAPEPTY